jgi:hypothetical protein
MGALATARTGASSEAPAMAKQTTNWFGILKVMKTVPFS